MSKKRKKSKSTNPAGNMPLIRAMYLYRCDSCGLEREIQVACGVDGKGDPVKSPMCVPQMKENHAKLYTYFAWSDMYELMQFLFHANETDIYEGDIMSGGVYDGCAILYCDKCKSFELFIKPDNEWNWCMSCERDVFWHEFIERLTDIKIAGNIYEGVTK